MNGFRHQFGETIFVTKYQQNKNETWRERAEKVVDSVCGTDGGNLEPLLPKSIRDALVDAIANMKFLPAGRYLYYGGRDVKFYNNCYLLKAEDDTREEWARLIHDSVSCLMTGGGIGIDYSIIRPKGSILSRTGGEASGAIGIANMINEAGRFIQQGGSRRSAIYGSINWQHGDNLLWVYAKDWDNQNAGLNRSVGEMKRDNFNFHAQLDMTNISLNYDDYFLSDESDKTIFYENVKMALKNGEPGFSFNFGDKSNETLRNACCEITSEDDSDVCNLGSINMSAIDGIEEFADMIELAIAFLLCGSIRSELPYEKVYKVREKNRRVGLGLMGVHEWLLSRGHNYSPNRELHDWMTVYVNASESAAKYYSERLNINMPVALRAIAPTGTIGILAGTTTGIEPIFATAYIRRYMSGGKWEESVVIDPTAEFLIRQYDISPDDIETAFDLSYDIERRIAFQAFMQQFVDHAISSTINVPSYDEMIERNEDYVIDVANLIRKYAPKLRGITIYPNGARGGQPLNPISYNDAIRRLYSYEATDVCDLSGGGTCGL